MAAGICHVCSTASSLCDDCSPLIILCLCIGHAEGAWLLLCRYDPELVAELVRACVEDLDLKPQYLSPHLVGMEEQVAEVFRLLNLPSNPVRLLQAGKHSSTSQASDRHWYLRQHA